MNNYIEQSIEQNTQQEPDKKLCCGYPITIQTKKEHKEQKAQAKLFFLTDKKREIEQKKREQERARERTKELRAELKAIKQKKFINKTYAEWVNQVREQHKEYKIIENEDSIKIVVGNPAIHRKWGY